MSKKQSRIGKRGWLTALLGAYILLQFLWWASLLVRQQRQIFELNNATDEKLNQAIRMIIGEGLVFFGLLSLGFIIIWRSIKREMEQAQKERHFLLAVTHELKTPIAGSQIAIDSLKKHEWDTQTKNLLLDDAQAGLTRLEQRVENILQNNRLISGKEMTKVLFEPEEIVTHVMQRHQVGPYQERVIELRNEIFEAFEIEGDADALALAWGNLLENALKYSPSNEPVIIAIAQTDDGLSVIFDDGGNGIPNDQRQNVLRKFERLKDSETSGTGLGLYLADQILKMHKGKLRIESNERGGSRIATWIPKST
ncbi:HAMP domain-containing histidine kinase [Flavobacteriales bacterium]|jgi:signal transduction histidine kinase|nr:HAMP domain-containing histidine kinase [Crocinitomicaceae bacterium]MDA7743387.1 HAMP domain-containing histidine kinase [Flavobacteriales bacterium]MDB4493723.1 HAMP domain-containing histidine kinase [Flavobacteriales bacterium]